MEAVAVTATRLHLELIMDAAKREGVPPAVLAGLVCQESAGNAWAMRHEPKFRWLPKEAGVLIAEKPGGMSFETELAGRKTSWGLCQLMGQVLREMGFRGWWPAACQPDVNLKYGARFLAAKIAINNGDVHAGLLAYNGGGVKEYPGRVLGWAKHFEEDCA